jgi:hypothetical protein
VIFRAHQHLEPQEPIQRTQTSSIFFSVCPRSPSPNRLLPTNQVPPCPTRHKRRYRRRVIRVKVRKAHKLLAHRGRRAAIRILGVAVVLHNRRVRVECRGAGAVAGIWLLTEQCKHLGRVREGKGVCGVRGVPLRYCMLACYTAACPASSDR